MTINLGMAIVCVNQRSVIKSLSEDNATDEYTNQENNCSSAIKV